MRYKNNFMEFGLEKNKIEIRPEVTILGVLRHLNYKPWFAIAEFVDNALQSYLSNGSAIQEIEGSNFKFEVDVSMSASGIGEIVIKDNAAGISTGDFPRAFRAAQIPADRSGLSEFGMGMKSAACWFAKNWVVRTSAIGEALERTIEFDVDNIIAERVETLEPRTRPVAANEHYTVVKLRGLHHPPASRTISKVREHLASIYRVFIQNGTMVLKFNNEELIYKTPKVLECVPYVAKATPSTRDITSIIWRKEIDFDFGNGQRVFGFAALREVGSTSLAGFSLFRRGRLIEGSCDETYRPTQIFGRANSYIYQRLFGELHVEGFAVSHTKDGFRWEEYEDLFLEFLKEAVESKPLDLLFQADNYRALPNRKNLSDNAQTATNNVAIYLTKEVAPIVEAAKDSPITPNPIPLTLVVTKSELKASEKKVTINDGIWIWEITLRTITDLAREQWLSIAKFETESNLEAQRKVEIELSLAHPFSMEYLGSSNENVELLLKMATAISVSLLLTQDIEGNTPDGFLHHLNHLLRGAIMGTIIND